MAKLNSYNKRVLYWLIISSWLCILYTQITIYMPNIVRVGQGHGVTVNIPALYVEGRLS